MEKKVAELKYLLEKMHDGDFETLTEEVEASLRIEVLKPEVNKLLIRKKNNVEKLEREIEELNEFIQSYKL